MPRTGRDETLDARSAEPRDRGASAARAGARSRPWSSPARRLAPTSNTGPLIFRSCIRAVKTGVNNCSICFGAPGRAGETVSLETVFRVAMPEKAIFSVTGISVKPATPDLRFKRSDGVLWY